MTSFRISVSPHRRAAARFVTNVHRRLQKAYAQNPEITQTAIAEKLGVHRSVINRQLRGHKDMTLGRVAELAWAMGYEPEFQMIAEQVEHGRNAPSSTSPFNEIARSSSNAVTKVAPSSGKLVVINE